MNYYFAPMEGITRYIYRNAHAKFFRKADKYFTPFVSPNKNRCFSPRELTDILPQNNKGLFVVPQILTNNSELFLRTAKELEQYGYKEVNLNLGCPSATVVTKHKGSGFLENREELDRFLDRVFDKITINVSIKTRIGRYEPEEFSYLIKIFNKYPLEELIVHPRIQSDFYKNKPNMEVFKEAYESSKNKLCYNGDVFSKSNLEKISLEYPDVQSVMIGRGLITNPALLNIFENETVYKEMVFKFIDNVCDEYYELFNDEKNVLFKMKEIWFYMIKMFPDSENEYKKIKKSQGISEYKTVVNRLLDKSF